MRKKKSKPVFEKDMDHLEAYPERKQVSAFPERRFIKTNRMLVILTIINLACMLAGAGLFIYAAKRIDVRVVGKKGIFLYQMDTEEKMLKPTEFLTIAAPAKRFIMEDYLKTYIIERHSSVDDNTESSYKHTSTGLVLRSSFNKLKPQIEKEFSQIRQEVGMSKRRDVHVYNLHPYRGNLWTAVVETFDFPKNIDEPICDCMDNSTTCLACKSQHNEKRRRYRVWIRAIFSERKEDRWFRTTNENDDTYYKKVSRDNPFGILVNGYYVGYLPFPETSKKWDLPPELK